MPRFEDQEEPVVVGQEAVYKTTPTTKLDPNVLRDNGIDIDGGYFAIN